MPRRSSAVSGGSQPDAEPHDHFILGLLGGGAVSSKAGARERHTPINDPAARQKHVVVGDTKLVKALLDAGEDDIAEGVFSVLEA